MSAALDMAPTEGASLTDTFRDVVMRLAPDVWRVLRRCGVSETDVDDAQQMVFIQMHKKWTQLGALDSRALRSYMLCVASGTAKEFGRGRARRFRNEDALQAEPEPVVTTPQDSLERKEACVLVDRILGAMDEERREVFVLYELQELSGREIAAHLGIPAGTVASRLRAAREQFERMVAELETERGTP
jgi:RNA polymerase sigma-70 factor (ECF subfamily)